MSEDRSSGPTWGDVACHNAVMADVARGRCNWAALELFDPLQNRWMPVPDGGHTIPYGLCIYRYATKDIRPVASADLKKLAAV